LPVQPVKLCLQPSLKCAPSLQVTWSHSSLFMKHYTETMPGGTRIISVMVKYGSVS
jgi:hypothetical protein